MLCPGHPSFANGVPLIYDPLSKVRFCIFSQELFPGLTPWLKLPGAAGGLLLCPFWLPALPSITLGCRISQPNPLQETSWGCRMVPGCSPGDFCPKNITQASELMSGSSVLSAAGETVPCQESRFTHDAGAFS